MSASQMFGTVLNEFYMGYLDPQMLFEAWNQILS
jgi:hypothetical protein